MTRHVIVGLALVLCIGLSVPLSGGEYVSDKVWPEPKVIDAGCAAKAPSDAIVLFDGKDLSQWEGWRVIIRRRALSRAASDNSLRRLHSM